MSIWVRDGSKAAPQYHTSESVPLTAPIPFLRFDSSFSSVVKAASDFRLHRDENDKFTKYKNKAAQLCIAAAGGGFRNLAKVLLTNVQIAAFIPAYSQTTDVCDINTGNMDTGLAVTASLVAWVLIFPVVHVLVRGVHVHWLPSRCLSQ